ncbi:MAG: protein kinase [Sandaracinaceae bacterium]
MTDSPRVHGRIIGGEYRIERTLGEGGMGTVYEVTQVRTGRAYAMKLLRPEAAHKRGAVDRFRREAEAISRLGHANVIAIRDFAEADGEVFLVMELLEGEDLATRMQRVGPFALADAMRVFGEVAAGLDAAHRAGFIHRDLKPANVFLARHAGAPERAVVLDFGLAKMFSDDTDQQLTSTGVIMGTPQYMSPEQASGLPLDQRTDLYSLATLLFHMLAGRPPFEAPTVPALFARLINEPPPNITALRPDLPPALDAVLARALAKPKEARFADAPSFVAAVHEALQSPGPTVPLAHAPTWPGPHASLAPTSAPRKASSRGWIAGLVLGALTLGCLGLAGVGALLVPSSNDALDTTAQSEPGPPSPTVPASSQEPVTPAPVAVAEPDAGAATMRATTPACTSALGCADSCDGAFASVALDESFDSGAMPFRTIRGEARREDGAYLLGGRRRLAMIETTATFQDVVTCVEARLPAMPARASRYEAVFGIRTQHRGASFNLRATDRRMGLLEIASPVRPAARGDCPWLGEELDVRVLLSLRDHHVYGELQRVDTGEVLTLSGDYRGPARPMTVELEMWADEPLRIERVRVGAPSDVVLSVAQRE